MKNGVERKRWALIQENAGFAPRNPFRSNRDVQFSWIGSQTDGRNLINGLHKSIKISRKLSFDPVQEFDG